MKAQVLSAEEDMFSAATKFLAYKLPANLSQIENDPDFRSEFYKEMADYGIMGMAGLLPYGSSYTSRQMAEIFELTASYSTGLAISLAAHTLCVYIISRWGTEGQKKRWLPVLCKGEKLGAFCLSEPKTGSDARSLSLKAVRSNKSYHLQGAKSFVTNGTQNSIHIVLGKAVDSHKEENGDFTAFIVEGDGPGLVIAPYKKKKVGFGNFPISVMRFEGYFLNAENRIGAEGAGFRLAMKALEMAKVNMGAIGVGLAESAYQSAVSYARHRKQFGRRIGDFQAVQFMLADIHTAIKTARLLVQDTADRFDTGRLTASESAMAKSYATDTAMKVVIDASQILGGAGLLQYPLEKKIWEAKLLQILEGTNQIQRVIIARSLLRKR